MTDESHEAQHVHPGAAESVVKLGVAVKIDVDDGDAYPILTITDGSFTLLVMPLGPSEGEPITGSDLANGSELVLAASRYRNALAEAYANQTGDLLPQRGASRRLLDRRHTDASAQGPDAGHR